MKFGFELEFGMKNELHLERLRREVDRVGLGSLFQVGVDCTAISPGYNRGVEVRTDKPFEGFNFPYESVKNLLTTIKQFDCAIGKECGVHFHFSGFGKIDSEKFLSIIKVQSWESRNTWCKKRSSDSETSKYQELRRVDDDYCIDHYECRMFNGTLNIRALAQYHTMLVKTLKTMKGLN
jgi:peroxiredoxin family protein